MQEDDYDHIGSQQINSLWIKSSFPWLQSYSMYILIPLNIKKNEKENYTLHITPDLILQAWVFLNV